MKSLLFSGFVLLSLQLCQQAAPDSTVSDDTTGRDSSFLYHLNEPDIRFELPSEWCEISGLSLSESPEKLYAISDEHGQFLLIDKKTGAIEAKPVFMAEGDFEGVERVGNIIYALKSNGKIFAIDASSPTQKYELIRTPLSKADDCEGLTYDASKNRLIISAKGTKAARSRYVFGWNLATNTLDTLLTIKDTEFASILRAQYPDAENKFDDFFGKFDEEFKFAPSSVLIAPTSGDYYLLSSVGKWLLVVDAKTSNIKHVMRLNKKTHAQPEGMVLDTDGTLWISNECKENNEGTSKSAATLLGFKIRK